MIKLDLVPVVGIVTIGTLTLVMTLCQSMARFAIRKAGMIERHLFPIGSVVTVGTLTRVMILRIVLQVTGLAICKTSVIKRNVLPIGDIGMAVHTSAEMQISKKAIRLAQRIL